MHIRKGEIVIWKIISERYRIYLKKRNIGKRIERLKIKKLY